MPVRVEFGFRRTPRPDRIAKVLSMADTSQVSWKVPSTVGPTSSWARIGIGPTKVLRFRTFNDAARSKSAAG
jgi:hypothetical protein